VNQEKPKSIDTWAIVEVMGHTQYAGRVTEEAIGGCSFVRVDVPENESLPGFTKLLGQAAIFSITPVTREVAIDAVKQFRARPMTIAGYAQQRLDFDDDDWSR
jgi:hypothetical protein